MERDERGTFDVPVRLLALGLQVDPVGESLVEQRDHLGAGRLRKIVLRGIQLRGGRRARRVLGDRSLSGFLRRAASAGSALPRSLPVAALRGSASHLCLLLLGGGDCSG